MKKKTRISKKRGPAPTGVGNPQLVRIHDKQLAEIDAWAADQNDNKISRPEAIRRLVELGLKAKGAKA
jgi:predicted transcriptional regulator